MSGHNFELFSTVRTKMKQRFHHILRKLLEDVVNEIRLNSPLCFGPGERLSIHSTAVVQNALFNTISGKIDIDELVFFGHNVSLLTGSHDVDKEAEERQQPVPARNDIRVMRGAWIASNAVIIGPCLIGEHAVVAAGSIVIHDVPQRAIVAGNPARVKKLID